MFSFNRKTSSPQPPQTLQQALTQQGLPGLRVLLTRGSYAGRSVRFFRAFNPIGAAHIQTFKDLDAHPELVLGSGHIENDGVFALAERVSSSVAPTPARELADRALHADDERLVFWNAEASRVSAVHLSEASATWHQARSTQAVEPVKALPRLAQT
jgi:hypothetical protein